MAALSTTADEGLARTFIRVPQPAPLSRARRLGLAVGGLLSPIAAWRARRYAVPGLDWHRRSFALAARAASRPGARVPWPVLYRMTFFPLDSTRYFEFDFLWRRALGAGGGPYLDVSSPRLFPLVFVRERRPAAADLVNPDASDLAVTARLVSAAGLDSRCRLHAETVDRLPFADGTYDLVTSMSVLEHIADDVQAVRTMWRVLRPGGRLLLTVPCARTASEQFIDKDEYGVLPPDAAGWWFWQRFYDERLLDRHVFAITGAPIHQEVYGEKTAGAFQANAAVKRADPAYPFWREPLMMARDYARFERVGDLPGEGVVGMEFVK